jgi:hypothetical protein
MPSSRKSEHYRAMIDSLVEVCETGAGQVGAAIVHRAVWNANAESQGIGEHQELNRLLENLSTAQRTALASALVKEFQAGVFETLKLLEANQITPFESGYEGSAYEDFAGRLGGWQWPKS